MERVKAQFEVTRPGDPAESSYCGKLNLPRPDWIWVYFDYPQPSPTVAFVPEKHTGHTAFRVCEESLPQLTSDHIYICQCEGRLIE